MTFRFYFFAEQAFLSQVKLILKKDHDSYESEIEAGAICAIACAAAIESIANRLISESLGLENFINNKLEEKIELIGKHNGKTIPWDTQPWQKISELIRTRNWLMHFKRNDIGLANSEMQWINDSHNKPPKIDPNKNLSKVNSEKYYHSVLSASKILALCANETLGEFGFLESESYQSVLIG